MSPRRLLTRVGATLAFIGFAGWAMWSEIGTGAVAQDLRQGRGDAAWRRDAVWDDGQAEFCAYDVSWARYGSHYAGTAVLVLVKEPWAPDLEVKADTPRGDGFDVLKLNHIRDVRTGIYTYHQMASVFLRRDDGAVRKLATTSAEACGITTALLVGGRLNVRSYFDGEGERTVAVPREALPEDGLPASLRDFVRGPAPRQVDILPSLLAGSLPDLAPRRLDLSRRKLEAVVVPAGTFAVTQIRLRGEAGIDLAYDFEDHPPFRLVRLARHDGTTYELRKGDRLAYWKLHGPADGEWLPEALR